MYFSSIGLLHMSYAFKLWEQGDVSIIYCILINNNCKLEDKECFLNVHTCNRHVAFYYRVKYCTDCSGLVRDFVCSLALSLPSMRL